LFDSWHYVSAPPRFCKKVNQPPLRLAPAAQIIIIYGMKLILVTAAHFLIAGVLGAGILMLMQGKPGLLIGGVAVYTIVFAKSCISAH
jgi:hypothetical protein